MDDQRLQLLFLILILITILGLVSLIQNTFNLLSLSRLNNLALVNEKSAQKIINHLDNQDRVFISLKILKTILTVGIVFLWIPLTNMHLPLLSYSLLFFVLLVTTEIFPLTLSKVNPEKMMLKLEPLVSILLMVVYPIYWILSLFVRLLILFFKPEVENIITEQELLTIVEEAQSEGSIQESEGDLIRRSIEFNELIVEEILTPRVDIVAVDIEWDLDKIAEVITENEFSRYPVYQENIDKIIGVFHTKDFRNFLKPDFDFKSIINPVTFVPESYKISKLLKQLQQSKNHLAVVIDEHGGTAGIVTLEDIIEELVGEIWDEHDDITHEILKINDHQYIILGSTELIKVFDLLDNDALEEDQFESTTMGGWVSELMSRIPQISDTIVFENVRLTVLNADEKRVHKVKLEILEKKEEGYHETTNSIE